jgi:hypothetical protein
METVASVLNYVAANRYLDGPAKGGWGKDYWDRYFDEMYPEGLPQDLVRARDSISWTAVVLDALRCIRPVVDQSRAYAARELFDRLFSDARDYLRRRYDQGQSGPYLSTTAGEGIVAKNVRHTASAVFAWYRAGGGGAIIADSLTGLVGLLAGGYDYRVHRAMSIAPIIGSLYLARYSDDLRLQVSVSSEQLDAAIGGAESALLARFDATQGLWDIRSGSRDRLGYWNALWILKFAFGLGYSDNHAVRRMSTTVLDRFLTRAIPVGDGVGIPLTSEGIPDIGATALLLEALRFAPGGEHQGHAAALADFVLDHHREPRFLQHSYSWSRANVVSALLADGPWGIRRELLSGIRA